MDETSKPNSTEPSRISRREFARRAAIASAAASVAPVTALATPAAHALPAAPPAQPPKAADMPQLSPEGNPGAEALIKPILRKCGTRLSDAQKTDIRRLCNL